MVPNFGCFWNLNFSWYFSTPVAARMGLHFSGQLVAKLWATSYYASVASVGLQLHGCNGTGLGYLWKIGKNGDCLAHSTHCTSLGSTSYEQYSIWDLITHVWALYPRPTRPGQVGLLGEIPRDVLWNLAFSQIWRQKCWKILGALPDFTI